MSDGGTSAEQSGLNLGLMIAHEMKSGLVYSVGSLEMIRQGLLSEAEIAREHQRLELIDKRLLELIDGLRFLDASRPVNFAISPVDVRQVVVEVVREMQDTLRSREQKLSVSSPKNLHHAYVNKTAVYHIVRNLIENASRYSPDKSVIKILLKQDKGFIVVRIRDYGIGVTPSELTRAVESADNTIRRPISSHPDSSGLGLYIASKLAAKFGGYVGVKTLKDGSSFGVFLPVIEQLRLFE